MAIGIVFVLASVRVRPHGLQMKDDFDRQEASRTAAGQPPEAPHTDQRRAA